VTDGKYVFVAFLDGNAMQVACYDFDGKQVWLRSPGQFTSVHGFCSSPVVYKDTVIFNADQDNPKSFLVALDKATGEERWRAKRPGVRSYCPPILIDVDGKTQLVFSGSKCVTSYDPDNGAEIWKIDGPTEQFVASLVYRDGILCLTAGFPTYHIMGIKPDGKGNVTGTHVAWHHDFERKENEASYVPSPIAQDKYFLVVSDTGFLHCLDIKTGERLWKERFGKHHSASPVTANGLVYFIADDGTIHVVKPGPTYELVATNKVDEDCRASPAIARGQIFIRTAKNLICIGK
jgi:outer membrane protein assembly factor BamB